MLFGILTMKLATIKGEENAGKKNEKKELKDAN